MVSTAAGVPLALALGYDRMVAAAIIFLEAGSGVIASTVNPFATDVDAVDHGWGTTDQRAIGRVGRLAAIGWIDDTAAMLRGEAGTTITADPVEAGQGNGR